MKPTNRFAAGSGLYACRCCKRNTRSTGRGDNENVQLCGQCFDLAREENHLANTGKLYEKPEFVRQYFDVLRSKGVADPEYLFPEVSSYLDKVMK